MGSPHSNSPYELSGGTHARATFPQRKAAPCDASLEDPEENCFSPGLLLRLAGFSSQRRRFLYFDAPL